MGEMEKFPYPRHTWSPAGGWWHEVPNWKSRLGVALVAIAVVISPLAIYSERNHVKVPTKKRRFEDEA